MRLAITKQQAGLEIEYRKSETILQRGNCAQRTQRLAVSTRYHCTWLHITQHQKTEQGEGKSTKTATPVKLEKANSSKALLSSSAKEAKNKDGSGTSRGLMTPASAQRTGAPAGAPETLRRPTMARGLEAEPTTAQLALQKEAAEAQANEAQQQRQKQASLGLKWMEIAKRPETGDELVNEGLSTALALGTYDFTPEDLVKCEVDRESLKWDSWIQATNKKYFKPASETVDASKVTSKLAAVFNASGAAKRWAREQREKKKAQEAQAAKMMWISEWSKWIMKCNVAELVLNALQMPRDDGENVAFDYMRGLTRETVEELLGAAKLTGLVESVMAGIEMLQGQAAPSGDALSEKFVQTGKFTMGYGNLSHFFKGLEGLLGPPAMAKDPENDNQPSILMGMQLEHTSDKDCHELFTSSNGVTTTSQIEWDFAVRPHAPVYLEETAGTSTDGGLWPERKGFRTSHPEYCRDTRSLDELMEDLEVKANSKLRAEGHSELIKEELLGGRLYTGAAAIRFAHEATSVAIPTFLISLSLSLSLSLSVCVCVCVCVCVRTDVRKVQCSITWLCRCTWLDVSCRSKKETLQGQSLRDDDPCHKLGRDQAFKIVQSRQGVSWCLLRTATGSVLER